VALVFQLRQDGGKQELDTARGWVDAAPLHKAGARLEMAPRSHSVTARAQFCGGLQLRSMPPVKAESNVNMEMDSHSGLPKRE